MMTQAEFDAALAGRLKKYGDYDELKAKADKLKALEDAQKSDADKVREQLTEAQQKLAEAQKQAEQATNAAREQAIQSAIFAEAAKQGYTDPMDAYRLLDRKALTVGEDGTIAGLAEAVTALATGKPYLKRSGSAPNVPAANPPRAGPQGRTDKERHAEYFGGGPSPFWVPEDGNTQ